MFDSTVRRYRMSEKVLLIGLPIFLFLLGIIIIFISTYIFPESKVGYLGMSISLFTIALFLLGIILEILRKKAYYSPIGKTPLFDINHTIYEETSSALGLPFILILILMFILHPIIVNVGAGMGIERFILVKNNEKVKIEKMRLAKQEAEKKERYLNEWISKKSDLEFPIKQINIKNQKDYKINGELKTEGNNIGIGVGGIVSNNLGGISAGVSNKKTFLVGSLKENNKEYYVFYRGEKTPEGIGWKKYKVETNNTYIIEKDGLKESILKITTECSGKRMYLENVNCNKKLAESHNFSAKEIYYIYVPKGTIINTYNL